MTSTLDRRRLTDLVATGSANWRWIVFAAGAAAMVVPTLATVAEGSWSTEQGAHGPIVLAIAIWLFVRAFPAMRAVATPGSSLVGSIALGALVFVYLGARVVGSIVIESAAMYGALVAALYLIVGGRALRTAWFPIAYFVFVLPPPGSWVATLTQPLRLSISAYAVDLLGLFGYPVAQTGLMIFVDQYALEVRAACSGLNSMISLSAIGLFYIYIRHNANLGYCALMSGIIICMALLANFARVLILILITYYFGDGAAQGFLHVFAGMTMFAVALLGLMAVDELATRLQQRFALRGVQA